MTTSTSTFLVDHKIHEKAVTLRLPTVPEDLLVYGEENSLKQVFVNLLINSVEVSVIDDGLPRRGDSVLIKREHHDERPTSDLPPVAISP